MPTKEGMSRVSQSGLLFASTHFPLPAGQSTKAGWLDQEKWLHLPSKLLSMSWKWNLQITSSLRMAKSNPYPRSMTGFDSVRTMFTLWGDLDASFFLIYLFRALHFLKWNFQVTSNKGEFMCEPAFVLVPTCWQTLPHSGVAACGHWCSHTGDKE